MAAKSMDDLTVLNDMVDALVDDTGAHAEGSQNENWSFASCPARVRSDDPSRNVALVGSFARTAHIPTSLPPGVMAVPLEQCLFSTPRVKTPQPDNAASLTKLFVGNMRFEMTREALRWVLYKSCEVDVPITHVLVHVKAAASNGQPTGCASLYVNDHDADRLIEMNQRIFCSLTTMYVTPSAEAMSALIEDRQILDFDARGKKLRGPKNSMVIERSRGTPTPTPTGSFVEMQYNPPSFGSMMGGSDSPLQQGSFSNMAYVPPRAAGDGHVTPPATPPLPLDSPSYERYPMAQPNAAVAQPQSPVLVDPVELFVGGIRYEATRAFVAWMLTRALIRRGNDDISIAEGQIRLFPGSTKRRSNNAGCAIVRLERQDAEKLQMLNHCVLCDAYGAYFGTSHTAMARFISSYHDKMRGGPSHAVVIEMRKSTTGTSPTLRPAAPPVAAPAAYGFVYNANVANSNYHPGLRANAPAYTGPMGSAYTSYETRAPPPAMPSWMHAPAQVTETS